jgi:hypothetical protein
MPLRTYDWGGSAALMTEHAAAWPASMRPVDPITAQICGAPVAAAGPATGKATERPVSVAVLDRPSVTLVPLPMAAAPVPDGQDHDDDDGQDHDDDDGLEGADDPSPDITAAAYAAGPNAPIEAGADDEPFEFDTGEKMAPDAARAVFAAQLAAWRDERRESFAPRDFGAVMRTTGMGRAWIQKLLREALEADPPALERDDGGRCYRFASQLASQS